jgi:hypothetical protein
MLVRCYSGFQAVFTETLLIKPWLGHFIHTYFYKRNNTEIDPTFLDVVPEDTYELDEINQRFQR